MFRTPLANPSAAFRTRLTAAGLCAALATLAGCATIVPAGPGHPADSAPETAPGVVSIPSRHTVPASLDRVTEMAKARGMTIFARVDHSGDAGKAGLPLRPTQLLILGAAKAGTPLMQARPLTALDLPLKVLAWEDVQGKTWLSYNDPAWLQQRHGYQAELNANVAGLAKLLEAAAQ